MLANRYSHHDQEPVNPLCAALDMLDSYGDGAGPDLDAYGTYNVIRPIRHY